MASPRVSCIVTCFNLGAFLPETLASIRAQTFRDFEICVIDDGSTDPLTQSALRNLGDDVQVVHSDHRGLPAARNLGVSRTSGEFICAVDADDLLAPTLLERSISRLDADGSLAFVSHWLEAFGDECWEWKPERCGFPDLLEKNTVNGAALVRRAAVKAVQGWDEGMRDGCEDWDFWITLVERGFRGDIIPEVLFRYRRRPDSMSRVKFADGGLTHLYGRLVDKHADTFRRHLVELATRREVDTAGNRRLVDDMDGRLELEILPALARARDDLAAADRRRSQWVAEQAAEAERLQQIEELGSLRRQLDQFREATEFLQGEIGATRNHARHLALMRDRAVQEHDRAVQEHDRAVQEIDAIKASWSWRLTEPLRFLGTLVHYAGRRRS